jgi:hypothetical protein
MTPLQSALHFAKQGYYILPLHTTIKGKCSCGNAACSSPGKHPRTKNGVKDATCEPAQIEAWGRMYPNSNYGIATGQLSGIVVLDIDDAGVAEKLLQDLPKTLTVKTGKGFHLYYAYPVGLLIPNRVRVMPGVDIRSDGGYVVAPRSNHTSGATYTIVGNEFVNDIPTELLKNITTQNGHTRKNTTSDSLTYREGARNDSLYRLGRALKYRGAKEPAIRAALVVQNDEECNPPLSSKELEAIIAQVLRQEDRPDFNQNGLKTVEDAREEATFTFIMASAMVKEQIPPLTWLLDTIIPAEGLTILGAYQKSGKTTFLYPLISAISRGDQFMGLDTIQTNVGLLAVEEPRSIVKERLVSCGFDPDDTTDSNLYIYQGGLASTKHVVSALDKEIVDKKLGLIAVDTLTTFLAPDDENSNAEIIKKLLPFKALRDKHGTSFIFVHHTRKNFMGDHRKAHRGASALGGFVDQIITMRQIGKDKEKESDDDNFMILPAQTKRLLEIIGRSEESPPKLVIDFDFDTRKYKILGNSLEAITDTKISRIWLALNGKPQSVEDLADRTKIPYRTVRRYLSKLLDSNEAKQVVGESTKVGGKKPFLYVRGPVARKRK